MRTLIVEDERLAADNLTKILENTGNFEILGVLESVYEVVEWFRNNKTPDFIFLDIHLADGSSFEIFDEIKIDCPIIFTTAYDEYALKAFEVNSIAYLLKPLSQEAVAKSLEKLKLFTGVRQRSHDDIGKLIDYFKQQTMYKTSFLIPVKGDKLFPLDVDEIEYFYIEEGIVNAVTKGNDSYILDKTMDEIADLIDPKNFFRANRQFIISRKAVKDIDLWFGGRLSINLNIPVPEKILVSKARVREFKDWLA